MNNLDENTKVYIEKTTRKNFDEVWAKFLSEFSTFLRANWGREYHDVISLVEQGKLDEFNNHDQGLTGFPSSSAYNILGSTFDDPNSVDMERIMSHESQQIFFYLYYDTPMEEKTG